MKKVKEPVVKTLDELGRIILPLETIQELGWKEKDKIAVITQKKKIILEKITENNVNVKKKAIIPIIIIAIVIIVGIIVLLINNKKNIDSTSNILQNEQHLNYIELTTDNWKNYFEIAVEKEEKKDTFGDVIRISEYFIIKLKEPYYSNGKLQDVAIKLKYSLLPQLEYTFSFNGSNQSKKNTIEMGWEDQIISIDDLECTKIKGNLIY